MNWVVMNVLGHDVQTASQSGVRTTSSLSVTGYRPSSFGTGLHAVTLAALRQYAVTGRDWVG